ncbi:MAG: potassium transporter TrkG [Pirellulaceae bacterium]
MPKLSGRIVKYPARASFIWYSGLILLGSLALLHPACRTNSAMKISALDSVFTSTSAACVTGLAVRSTENDFSFLGQAVILLLIQLGGIGIMTVTTFVLLSFGRGASLRSRLVIRETLGGGTNSDLGWILRRVLLITALSEGAGFLILAVRFLFQLPFPTALWHALFHSISAFCNAGFALHDDSLSLYRTDPVVNLTISALIIVGGLGFPVILDLERNWNGTLKDRWLGMGLHSKIMLIGTTALLVFGFCSFWDWNGTEC